MPKLPRSKAYFMLIVLALTAYLPVLKLGFMWDDHIMVEQNPYIREWSVPNLMHDFANTVSNNQGDEGYLRPVVTWSNRLDYTLWGLKPFGYHLTSLLLHAANGLLVYELILLLGCTPIAAFLAASLFAVHPICVEGIMIITGRATLLSFFFGIGALLLASTPSPTRVALALVSFALALLSKEQSVVIPLFLILLWKRMPPSRFKRRDAIIAFFAVLAGYLYYRQLLFGSVGVPHDWPYAGRFFTLAFPRVLNHYISLMLVPWNLHSHRMIMRLSHVWFLWTAFWVVLVGWLYQYRKPSSLSFFCVAWLIIGLLPPSLAMLYGGFMLDHWGYWIVISVCLPLGLLVQWLWTQKDYPRMRWMAGLYFPLVIVYALVARLNIELRSSDEKMYRWALHFTTSSPIRYNLGVILLETNRAKEAIPYFSEVRSLYPEDLNNTHALGLAYWKAGQPEAALKILEVLHTQHPGYAPAAVSLKTVKALLAKRPRKHS